MYFLLLDGGIIVELAGQRMKNPAGFAWRGWFSGWLRDPCRRLNLS
jgi:hypothetical protein